MAIGHRLIPALERCGEVLAAKAAEWKDVLKIGRTHLADATPFSLGQEIGGLACQLERSVGRAAAAMEALFELPIGGTAIGTGINTHPDFGRLVCAVLADETGIPFVEAADHFEANAQRDGLVECHGQLRTIAATMFNVANNIRWLASGPRCWHSRDRVARASARQFDHAGQGQSGALREPDAGRRPRAGQRSERSLFCGAAGGQFQLNVMMPLMADATLESVRLLANATGAFTAMCLAGMKADAETCEAAVERSLAIATALNPYIGYERGRPGERGAGHRQDDPRTVRREEGPSRGTTQRSPRSLADDPPEALIKARATRASRPWRPDRRRVARPAGTF